MEIRRAREKKRNLKALILREIAVIAYTTEKKTFRFKPSTQLNQTISPPNTQLPITQPAHLQPHNQIHANQ